MYPEITKVEKGVVGQALAGIGWFTKKLLGNAPTAEAFIPPSTKEMVKQCLFFYLEPYKHTLLCGYDENFCIEGFVEQVKLIVEQHHTSAVLHHGPFPSHVKVENLKEVCIMIFLCNNIFVLFRNSSDG